MALNIKNEEAVRLARDVAGRTGESLTDAIRVALQERLDRLESEGPDTPRQRVDGMLARFRRELERHPVGISSDDLYDDETGLPR